MDYRYLMEKAKEVSENAYVKYSNFPVGACVLMGNNHIYTGCNFENSSFGMTICAERNAIGTGIANGERKIYAIAIYSPKMENCTPCGACRQVIHEFQAENGVDIITEINGELKIYKINELLPEGFNL